MREGNQTLETTQRIEINGRGTPELVLWWSGRDGNSFAEGGWRREWERVQFWDLDEVELLFDCETRFLEEEWANGAAADEEATCKGWRYELDISRYGLAVREGENPCEATPENTACKWYTLDAGTWQRVQPTAGFYADSVEVMRRHGGKLRYFERIQDFEWVINGQSMTWSPDTLHVPVNPFVLDTIRWRRDSSSDWQLIICNIHRPEGYSFVFNECCGGFNVRSHQTGRFTSGKVEFRLKGAAEVPILGVHGDGSTLLEPDRPVQIPFPCKSAMASNLDWIQVLPVQQVPMEECEEGFGTMCFFEEGKESMEEVCFNLLEGESRFLYLFLEEERLVVEVDGTTGELSLGWEFSER